MRNMVTVHTKMTAMLASLDWAAETIRLWAAVLVLCLSEGRSVTRLLSHMASVASKVLVGVLGGWGVAELLLDLLRSIILTKLRTDKVWICTNLASAGVKWPKVVPMVTSSSSSSSSRSISKLFDLASPLFTITKGISSPTRPEAKITTWILMVS